jgi:hypothetical protein
MARKQYARRVPADGVPAREIVTGAVLRDPPAWRAGRVPAIADDAAGFDPLAPRRYRPEAALERQ